MCLRLFPCVSVSLPVYVSDVACVRTRACVSDLTRVCVASIVRVYVCVCVCVCARERERERVNECVRACE